MKLLSTFVSVVALAATCVSAAPQSRPVSSISNRNPFAGHNLYVLSNSTLQIFVISPREKNTSSFVSPVYREQIQREIRDLRRNREFELARKAAVVANSK